MAWWSSITSFFTGSKTGSSVVSAALEGLDNWNFSDEEKAKYSKDFMKEVWIDMQKTIANENSLRSITRRILAIGIIFEYLGIILAGCLVYKFDQGYSAFLFEVAKSLNTFVFTVVVFYFGYYAISNVMKAKKG